MAHKCQCGHGAIDHGDGVIHSACCAGSCECPEYDSLRYVVTARVMFDNDEDAHMFIHSIGTQQFGDFDRTLNLEEI